MRALALSIYNLYHLYINQFVWKIILKKKCFYTNTLCYIRCTFKARTTIFPSINWYHTHNVYPKINWEKSKEKNVLMKWITHRYSQDMCPLSILWWRKIISLNVMYSCLVLFNFVEYIRAYIIDDEFELRTQCKQTIYISFIKKAKFIVGHCCWLILHNYKSLEFVEFIIIPTYSKTNIYNISNR